MMPTSWPWGMGRLSKGTMTSASTLGEKTASPAVTLMPGNSFPSHVSLITFELLPQHWNSASESEQTTVWALHEEHLGLQKPSLSHSPCWFLQPE